MHTAMTPQINIHQFEIYGTIMNSMNFNYTTSVIQNEFQLRSIIFILLTLMNMDPIKLLDICPYLEHVDIDVTIDNILKFKKQKTIDYFQCIIANKHDIVDYDNFKIIHTLRLNKLKEAKYISEYEYNLWNL
jgi:hypothetical protein